MTASRNGCFQLIHDGNQTSLKVYPPKGEGKPVSLNLIARYFDFIKLVNSNRRAIKNIIDKSTESGEPMEIKISDKAVYPHDELVFVDLDEDRMRAVCTFIPPSSKGKLMSRDEIVEALAYNDIKFGIQEDMIEKYVKNRIYCTELVMARGVAPIEGKSAVIRYNFNTKLEAKPKVLEDGTVDFHNLDVINHVTAGDVLAVMEPMVEGIAGKDLWGWEVPPRKVRNAVMKHGKNIHLSEDGLTMYTEISGHVGLAGDRVFVSDVYEVPADVSVASGNIEYNGSVVVKGNVVTGFSVKADGDIIVDGVVEGATLIAGGQIYLKRGIQGMGKGELVAGGNIVSRFMENCTAKSGQDILADAIMHSHVTAVGTITVSGKKGLITGGVVKATEKIDAITIGSAMGTKTDLVIDITDEIMAEYRELEEHIEKVKEEQEKYIQIINICQKKLETGKATQELVKAAQLSKLQAVKIQTENQDKIDRFRLLKAEIHAYRCGRVCVQNTAYPGVEIKMRSEILRLKKEAVHCQFVLDRADIKSEPLS